MSARRAALGVAALVVAGSGSGLGGAAHAGGTRAVEADCSGVQAEVPRASTRVSGPSSPLELMRVPEAHELLAERGVRPGAGVRVAVLDSGIARAGGVTVVDGPSFGSTPELLDWHGTAVAGLIAGDRRPGGELVGIAPDAEVVDVRIYDERTPADATTRGVTALGVAAGLRWVLDRRAALGIDIVNVSHLVPADPTVERLVEDLWAAGVVVVASAGNRPRDPLEGFDISTTPSPGEDAADQVFPAGYEDVVAVSATTGGLEVDQPTEDGGTEDGGTEGGEESGGIDASQYVLPNSRTDVAAPTAGAVSVAVNGGTCLIGDVATSWSAAEVSGVLALLKSLHPDDTAPQLVARLVATADGRADVVNPMTGAGVVQPLEALRRPLRPDAAGAVAGTALERTDERVTAPAEPVDPLAGARRQALWWGLVGGGALLLALLLRPVLARRTHD